MGGCGFLACSHAKYLLEACINKTVALDFFI